jgi:DNA helicase-2/ATP-dependent DNA helicase PcrA
LEDLRSLCRAAQAFDEQYQARATVRGFLEHAIGLHAEELCSGEDRRVTVSTIHRSKGTGATLVIALGCEEQLLPSWQSIASLDKEAVAEERRLFSVAATRTGDRLVLTHVGVRGGATPAGPRDSCTSPGCSAGQCGGRHEPVTLGRTVRNERSVMRQRAGRDSRR